MTMMTRRDLEMVALLAMFTPIGLVAPESAWPWICRQLAQAANHLAPGRRRDLARRMPAFLPRLSGLGPQEIITRHVANAYEENLATVRESLPGGWHPRLAVIGREHLDNALSSGKGAILWDDEFEFSSLVRKKALAGAGYRVVQLARPSHGFSSSPFVRRFLNPIQIKAEDRYLEARVLIDENEMIRGLRDLRRRLEAGAIISITVGGKAVKSVQVPLFDTMTSLATGPLTLARAAASPLLPVFTVRTQAGFEIYIEPPLDLARRDDLAPYLQYARLMGTYLERWPLAWRGWSTGGLNG